MTRFSDWALALAFALALACGVAGYLFGRATHHTGSVVDVTVDQDIDSLKDLASELQRVKLPEGI